MNALSLVTALAVSFVSEGIAPGVAPSPAPAVACRTPDAALSSDIVSAYENLESSHAIQAFISALGSATPAVQHTVVSQAPALAKSPERAGLEGALAKACATPNDVIGFSRAVTTVSYEWKDDGLQDPSVAEALTKLVSDAVSALGHDAELTANERTTAARPFAALAESTPPSPLASGTAVAPPCANRYADARALHVVPLSYPPSAIAVRATGSVSLKVTLSQTGGVESVTVYETTVGDGPGTRSLINAAIVSAASSTYAPEIVDCNGSAGSYIFKAVFKAR